MTGIKLYHSNLDLFYRGQIRLPKKTPDEMSKLLKMCRAFLEGTKVAGHTPLQENPMGKPTEKGETVKIKKVVVPEIPITERLKLVKPGQTVEDFYKCLVKEMVARCDSIPAYLRQTIANMALEDTSVKTPAEKIQDAAAKIYVFEKGHGDKKISIWDLQTDRSTDRYESFFNSPVFTKYRWDIESIKTDLPPKPDD